jgi:iron complex outermembrane recepter protein
VKRLFSIFIALGCSLNLISQGRIEGKINDDKAQPAPFCALALLKSSDSSQVKGNITDADGKFFFEAISSGTFIIKASAAGFDDGYSALIIIDSLSEINLEPIIIKTKAVNLNEVAVTVIKKPVEFKNGNIVMNVQDSPIAIGNTVYDLLTKLPGVSIIDDVISIQGKSGVRIMIDDRIQQLPGNALINMLRSMSSSNVDKIEILKNPPSKYDASGSGLINIKLKKVKLTGFSGSTYLNYMQGFYSIKDGGLSLNYKGKNFAIFSNFTSGINEYRYYSIFTKRVTFNNSTTEFHQVTGERNANLFYTLNGGADWYINKNNTIGFKVDGGDGAFTSYRTGNNYLSDNSLGYNELEFGSIRPNYWRFLNVNINSEHKLDTNGAVLKISADYSPNGDIHKGNFQNYFLDSLKNNVFNCV